VQQAVHWWLSSGERHGQHSRGIDKVVGETHAKGGRKPKNRDSGSSCYLVGAMVTVLLDRETIDGEVY
jgi:hypothetical protein